jgi:hypothetical protein
MIKGGVVEGNINPVFRQAESAVASQDLVAVPDKLKRGNATDLSIFMPRKQLIAHTDPIAVTQITYPNTSTNLLTTSSFEFFLTRGAVDVLRGPLVFRFRLTNAGASSTTVVLAPPPLWFDHIDVYFQGHSYKARTFYGDALYLYNLLFCKDSETMKCWARFMNMGDDVQSGGGRRDEKAGILRGGQTRDFYLLIPDGVFDNTKILMPVQNQDIRFVFYPVNTSGTAFTSSGTSTNITCTEFALHIPEEHLDSTDMVIHTQLYKQPGRVIGHNYLDTQQITLLTQSTAVFAASATINVDLTNFSGLSAFILLMFRNIAGPPVATSDQYLSSITDLGDDCTFDIKENNNSLYGNGLSVKGSYLRYILGPQLFKCYPFNNLPVYPIVFAQDPIKSMKGILNGYMDFNPFKIKKTLQITLPPAGVSEIHTLTQTGGNMSAGNIIIAFKGELTQPLAFNTSAANLAVAVNALPSIQRLGLSVVFSQAFSAGNPTVTWTSPGCNPVESMLTVILGPTVATCTNVVSTVTTNATPGFTSATNYSLYAYNFYHRDVYDQGGVLSAMSLGNDAQSVFQY